MRQVNLLVSQGRSVAEAVRPIGVTQVTYDRWRKGFGGLKTDQMKRLKEPEKEKRAAQGLVGSHAQQGDPERGRLGNRRTAQRDFGAPPAAGSASTMRAGSSACPNGLPAACWGSIGRRGRRGRPEEERSR